MKTEQLTTQLNNLQKIKADSAWKEQNRSILVQQVLNGEPEKEFTFFSQLNLVLSRIFQPAYVAVMIAVFFIAAGVFGWYGSANSRPGDSLYVAKIAKEKALMTITFDNQAKARLNVEFAQNRLKELNQVIASKQNPESKAKVVQLKADLKKEIKHAKEKIALPQNLNENSEDKEFFTAGVGKTNQEVEVAIPENEHPEIITANAEPTTITATANVETATKESTAVEPAKILTEAEKLLDNNDLAGVADKLSEVNQIINNPDEQTTVDKDTPAQPEPTETQPEEINK